MCMLVCFVGELVFMHHWCELQVWDDASQLPAQRGMADTIHGRRTRRAYLLAEARVEVPIHSLLGLTSQRARAAKAAQRNAKHGGISCAGAAAKCCSGHVNLGDLPYVRMTHALHAPERGIDAGGSSYARKRQHISISLTYCLKVCWEADPLRIGIRAFVCVLCRSPSPLPALTGWCCFR